MKRFASFLCVLCLIGVTLTTGFAEGSSAYRQAYIAMLEEFERGNYADAYIAAEIVYGADPNYEQIVSYYNYLTALQVYLPSEQYKEAYDTFYALSLRKFQKSEGYAAYALGCQYEKDMDYAAALEQYQIAFKNNIDKAYQRIQECQKKISEMRYNLALELQRQKEFLAAAEIFESLKNDYPDAQEKAKACYDAAAVEQRLEQSKLEITYSANGFAVDDVNARLLDRTYIDYFPGKDDTTRRLSYYEKVFNIPAGDTTYDLFAAPVDLGEIPAKALGRSELVLCLHYIQRAASSETVEGKLILEGLASGTIEKTVSLYGFQKTGLIFIGTDELVPDAVLWRAGTYRLFLMLDGLTAYTCVFELV